MSTSYLFLHRTKDDRQITEGKKFEMIYSDSVAAITVRDSSEKDAGTYTCEASNDLGSVSTSGQLEIQGHYFNFNLSQWQGSLKNPLRQYFTDRIVLVICMGCLGQGSEYSETKVGDNQRQKLPAEIRCAKLKGTSEAARCKYNIPTLDHDTQFNVLILNFFLMFLLLYFS